MSQEVKQVIVVRKDLDMTKGKTAAQVAHASLGAVLQAEKQRDKKSLTLTMDEDLEAWLSGPFAKIVLACNSLEELLELQNKSRGAGLRTCLITDAGRTEFKGVPTVTCLAIGPAKVDKIDKITSSLKLL